MTTTEGTVGALTPKQRRVIHLLREGKSPTEIAKAMHISASGVHGHLRQIRRQPGGEELVEEARSRTNGGAPEASPEPVVGKTNGLVDEADTEVRNSLYEAITVGNTRLVQIDEEVEAMQKRAEGLKSEHELVKTRVEGYELALKNLSGPQS